MTIYSKHSGGLPGSSPKSGDGLRAFSLVEMMFTVSLLALALMTMIPTFGLFTRGVAGLGNYAAMSQESRRGLELISRDLHAAEVLNFATASELTLTLPDDAGGGIVNYRYAASQKTLTRSQTPLSGEVCSVVLFNDMTSFRLLYYNRLGASLKAGSASILNEAKSVQINAELEKKVMNTMNTDYIISARFLMRNK